VAYKDASREAHFPAIERRYGEKMAYWFKVMAKRFETPTQYFKTIEPKQAKTVRAILKTLTTKFPQLELVIAWNQPMIKFRDSYVFGISTAKNHILFAPWSQEVLERFRPKMKDLDVKKKTVAIPNDWLIDEKLLIAMAKARIAEIK
jgi:uncharacterized protein|tara:strand:- start:4234 stop:4674 length:441 start_codon:yes stop_codon:yes gene_type:complete